MNPDELRIAADLCDDNHFPEAARVLRDAAKGGVTISRALQISKATGATFVSRGWAKYDENHTYRFSAEAMVADDWEPLTARDAELAAPYLCSPATS